MKRGFITLPTDIDWVAAVKRDYVDGKIDVEELESEIEDLLRGGFPSRFFPIGLPPRPDRPDPLKRSSY